MSPTTDRQDYWVNPRIKISALWTSMLFVFAYVDLFGLFRSDVRADIEAGKISGFTIGQGYLLGVTIYVLVPSLMVFLSLALPARVTRVANIVLAALYAVTVAGSAVGEWNYFILGSLTEAVLLAGVVYYAWTWPKGTGPVAAPPDQSGAHTQGPVEETRSRTGTPT
jgi:hypothetical protein